MNKDLKTIKVGIIGCGGVAKTRHIPVWKYFKNVQIAAVCDTNINNAKSVAQAYNVDKFTSDYQDLLNENLDIVDICTPIAYHAEQAVAAIKNKFNVLIEKPIALDVKQAKEIIDASKKYDTKVCVCHSVRYNPGIREAKKLIDEGYLGSIMFCRIMHYVTKPIDWRLDKKVGLLGEFGCHDIDLHLWLLGKIKSISAFGHYDVNDSQFDEIHILHQVNGGAIGSIDLSYTTNTKWTAEFYGSEGELFVELFSGIVNDPLKRASRLRYYTALIKRGLSYVIYRERVTGHYYLIRDFLKSVINNTNSPIPAEEANEYLIRKNTKVSNQEG